MTRADVPDLTRTSARARRAAAALGACLIVATPAVADEATKLSATYNVRLAIVPIAFATGTLTATLPDVGRYTVDFGASGMGFAMSGKAVGTVFPDGLSPISAAIDSTDSAEKRSIRIAMSRGRVRRELVTPPVPFKPDRVPMTQADRVGVIDPISALVMPNKGALTDASNCDRTLPIFEGTERFNIRLSYLRTEQVKTLKGYEGQAIVCRANYKAIAGHRKQPQVAYMESNQTMETWLVPIAGTQLLAPWKVSLGTRIGTMIIEAQEFTSSGDGTKHADAGGGTAR